MYTSEQAVSEKELWKHRPHCKQAAIVLDEHVSSMHMNASLDICLGIQHAVELIIVQKPQLTVLECNRLILGLSMACVGIDAHSWPLNESWLAEAFREDFRVKVEVLLSIVKEHFLAAGLEAKHLPGIQRKP